MREALGSVSSGEDQNVDEDLDEGKGSENTHVDSNDLVDLLLEGIAAVESEEVSKTLPQDLVLKTDQLDLEIGSDYDEEEDEDDSDEVKALKKLRRQQRLIKEAANQADFKHGNENVPVTLDIKDEVASKEEEPKEEAITETEISNPGPEISNPGPEIRESESEIKDPEPEIKEPEPETNDPETEITPEVVQYKLPEQTENIKPEPEEPVSKTEEAISELEIKPLDTVQEVVPTELEDKIEPVEQELPEHAPTVSEERNLANNITVHITEELATNLNEEATDNIEKNLDQESDSIEGVSEAIEINDQEEENLTTEDQAKEETTSIESTEVVSDKKEVVSEENFETSKSIVPEEDQQVNPETDEKEENAEDVLAEAETLEKEDFSPPSEISEIQIIETPSEDLAEETTVEVATTLPTNEVCHLFFVRRSFAL